ncbi:MAG TPA: hypothetical protein VJ853_02800 [Thermoanaerobaculia bacterium]|nr:hypothetical protein [Thermoanaerobaculia bacterium]
MRVVWVRLAASIVVAVLAIVAAADDLSGPVSFVPWKVLMPGDAPAKSPLTLFWIPASVDDFKHSEMLFSRSLTLYASQCVAMQVIRADDQPMIEKLGGAGALPVAVLVDADGKQLGKVANDGGVLRVGAVERLVREQIRVREAQLDAQLDTARRSGDVVALRSICDQRCAFPREARAAQKELKRLGVELAAAH